MTQYEKIDFLQEKESQKNAKHNRYVYKMGSYLIQMYYWVDIYTFIIFSIYVYV